jgi:3',5'-cyclic-AMP phosphodiesterase
MTDDNRPEDNRLEQDADGIDRRGFLKCMAWAGTGVLWTISGGILTSRSFAQSHGDARAVAQGTLHFAQISDSHIGFNKPANPDVTGTLEAAIAKINALPVVPSFLIHTGDITHLAQADQFDTSDQLLKTVRTDRVFYVPGEHDVASDEGKLYRQRYPQATRGDGWYSFDQQGVHFIGLVNVMNLTTGGLGNLGQEQLAWLARDLKGHRNSTPIVVFAHIPLWMVYPEWGWGTSDGAQALSYLKRFGSVTVLNGHIHQTMQKVEGNVTFHTATSTAFPQPQPGKAAAPGPMKVPAEQLREVLGITAVNYVKGDHTLAIIDSALV